jgi:DNA (cytosine-5)-methyltransferase 1
MMHMADWTDPAPAAPIIGQAVPELSRRPRLIDLFGGAGGMTAGFSPLFGHSFDPVWANDMNRDAAATYNANFGDHCLVDDIVSLLRDPRIVPEADVVIGGPPCQGFSLLNKGRRIDPRKQLWYPFMEVVQRSGAWLFVIETEPQLLGSLEHEQIVEYAELLGFTVRWAKLCAADYGVPQVRWRAFIVGCNFADPAPLFPPKRTHFKPRPGNDPAGPQDADLYSANPLPWRTVWDAIGDLPEPLSIRIGENPPLNLHFGRKPTDKSMLRYQAIPDQGMNRFDLYRRAPDLTPDCWVRKTSGGTDLFGRLWWDRPAFTIRTEFFKPEKGRYLHPTQHRPITHREAARLQSFPDPFRFLGSKSEIARQIGNAVPPLLAARIADSVLALLATQAEERVGEPHREKRREA